MERHSAKIKTMLMSLTVAAGIAVTAMSAQAANEKLKIGFVVNYHIVFICKS
mgnify:CR=1 FL=1